MIGLRLGRALHLAPGLQAELLYALLLKDAGCSANASLVCDLFGGCDHEVKRAVWTRDWRRVPERIAHAIGGLGRGSSLVARMRQFGKFAVRGAQGSGTEIFAVRCERGARIARMVGLSDTVAEAILAMDEHWDGGGYPEQAARAPDASAGAGRAGAGGLDLLVGRAGRTAPSTLPASGAAAGSTPSSSTRSSRPPRNRNFWTGLSDARLNRDLLTLVPAGLEIPTDDVLIDHMADAFALIIDAKSPFTFAHSARVAGVHLRPSTIGSAIAPSNPVRACRAAPIHDIGKLAGPEHNPRQAGPPRPQRARRRRAAPGLHAVAPPARPGVQRVRRRRRQPPATR